MAILTIQSGECLELFRFRDGKSDLEGVVRWNKERNEALIDTMGMDDDEESVSYCTVQPSTSLVIADGVVELFHRPDGGLDLVGTLEPGVCAASRAPIARDAIVAAFVDQESDMVADFVADIIGQHVLNTLELSYPPLRKWGLLDVSQGIGAAFLAAYIRRIAVPGLDVGARWRADQVLTVWNSLAHASLTATVDAILMSQDTERPVQF